ncbi:hypothetical protein [Halochromatium salexigens]|uniref:hypothetical protein n=1 Tax=Halochromatium salexigens TaxID=49447 RepID=UPI0019128F6B|nr:hypothetical protein [Halochromatium salexigens]
MHHRALAGRSLNKATATHPERLPATLAQARECLTGRAQDAISLLAKAEAFLH